MAFSCILGLLIEEEKTMTSQIIKYYMDYNSQERKTSTIPQP